MVLCDWHECLKRIAMAAPETEPGQQQQYHYLSYGWLCGGIIQVISTIYAPINLIHFLLKFNEKVARMIHVV